MNMRNAVLAAVVLTLSIEAQENPAVVVAATEGHVWETSITYSAADAQKAVAVGVVYGMGGSPNVQPFYTEDGGRTWHYGGKLGYTTTRRTYLWHGDPVVASDRQGVMYAATLLVAPSPVRYSGIGVSRSFDNGKTWDGPFGVVERTPQDSPRYADDKEWISTDTTGGPHDGNIYVTWIRARSNNSGPVEGMFSRSTDGGETWSPELVLGNGSGGQISIGPNGELHVLRTCGDNHYCSQLSTDGGVTFEPPVRIAPSATFVSNAVDVSNGPNRGTVYMAWIASITGPQLSRSWIGTVYFTRSIDSGRSWEAPRAMNAVNSGTALLQTVASDPITGDVVLTWLDRREHPGTKKFRLYSTRSTDGGRTFSEPAPVTPVVDMTGDAFIGDYNTTAAYNGVFLSTFSDGLGRMSVARLVYEPKVPEPPSGPRRRSVRH